MNPLFPQKHEICSLSQEDAHQVTTSLPHAGSSTALLPLMLLGVFSGLISGLLGVGGGTVLVPVLALLFSFPQSEAQGSALLAMLLPSVAQLNRQ